MATVTTQNYRSAATAGIGNPVLQKALANLQRRFGKGTAEAYRRLPEGPDLRLKAHDIRMESIENLDLLLDRLTATIIQNGGHVYFAEDAVAAVAYILQVARENGVRRVVKGKSMVSEEIGLNGALAAEGIDVAETDLGEYIVQLAGEHPSHIIAPAIHKTRDDIGRLFADNLGIDYSDDPSTLTQAARRALREKFLAADMGITGCNLACAETGHITVVSNEGNIRMASTMPRVHVAVMGMERVIARLEDHDVLFRLLTRGAAAQNMATYVSYVGGPRRSEQADGPDAFHLVVLDNGRSKILADPRFREMLCCIRCAACLNVCPVYGKIGGHAYGYPYSGPVGAVVTPLLVGINRARHLCQGETLCGACQTACPVNIDIPRMLLALRAQLADGDPLWGVVRSSPVEKISFGLWSRIVGRRRFYDLALCIGRLAQRWLPQRGDMIRRLPPPLDGWTRSRDMPPLASKSFRDRWKERGS
ncbi:MAG TPA: LutB/LldF family L-lactate oxidation iron-sulfur protein [Desulfosarcina sp.]|nr:LutB/LldF family L-lactate oxidation iron-sulfur protein [Desulfosarcina sp.]